MRPCRAPVSSIVASMVASIAASATASILACTLASSARAEHAGLPLPIDRPDTFKLDEILPRDEDEASQDVHQDVHRDVHPAKLMLQPAVNPDHTVYAPPAAPTDSEGANTGGINLNLRVTYLSDYIYRGIDRTQFIGLATGEGETEEKANFQFEGAISFNLGKLPHPFIGVFVNVLDEDPVSTFQEIRPVVGAELYLRPFIFAGGNNTYLFPDRDELNTGEFWGKITLDDAAVLRNDEPLLSPYIYAAYDYDVYSGWYFEAGISHDFVLEGTGITLTTLASIAYVHKHGAFEGPEGEDSGLHHYQLGAIGRYSLNELLNIPQRFGQWSLNGYVYYADGIDQDLREDTGLWGGGGIELRY